MPVDFSGLTLLSCENAFAIPITVDPVVSQPGKGAYQNRGIWDVRHIDVMLEQGMISTRNITLGIRLAEYPDPPPAQGDYVLMVTSILFTIPGVPLGTALSLKVDDVRPDGQGGAYLNLKRVV
jgi:hypothetical protein